MTPACDALDRAGVGYRSHPYKHDPGAKSYGLEAAEKLGLSTEVVFKTLMARLDSGELVVAVLPVDKMLDLKALARVFGAKKAALASVDDATRSSGYVVGGISPLGQRSQRRTAIDEHALLSETIFVSGGRRGLDIEIDPTALIALLDAEVVPLTR